MLNGRFSCLNGVEFCLVQEEFLYSDLFGYDAVGVS